MPTDELHLPGPPDDYSDAEAAAFIAGARTLLNALGQQCDVMAAAYANGPTADDSADETDACPACDDGTIEQTFGTERCRDCGHTPQEAP